MSAMGRARAKVRKHDREQRTTVERVQGSSNQMLVVQSPALERQIVKAVTGLLRVARTAMPETFYATDARVRRGQQLLAMFGRKPVR